MEAYGSLHKAEGELEKSTDELGNVDIKIEKNYREEEKIPEEIKSSILTTLKDEPLDAAQIADLMGISEKMAENLLERLIEIGKVERKDGRYNLA